ncbi:hypothetical protein GGR16_000746 [Chelatococcus caeni]|uniref:Uncharacterized protein n=1 Tax=Chelatococcus caeni TaxID=1348468 RepID=A0A840BRV1_9HYPH|nr:hypothetical protein [Chelatococcus caeni]
MADFMSSIPRPVRSARRAWLSDATARMAVAYSLFALCFGFTLAVIVGVVR